MLSSVLGSSLSFRLLVDLEVKVDGYMQIVLLVFVASLLLSAITIFLLEPNSEKGGSNKLTNSMSMSPLKHIVK